MSTPQTDAMLANLKLFGSELLWIDDFDAVLDKMRELERENERLRADGVRLDWVEKNGVGPSVSANTKWLQTTPIAGGFKVYWGDTIRAAIDSAMSAKAMKP